ncbi:Tn3 family transposase [Pseudarthrobacter sp. SSS035]|uniref:Tn3 family transposase n=1 Tax=Pseudarthrobacter sp. SSS035 TaxID=2931399 RepID=UPI00201097AE|nr:Tn3 family transposase [Pseudarthrobacter sp. SSS035]
MAGEYLTAAEEAAYGRYALEAPDRSVLERFFFLDDFDHQLVAKRRGDYNRLGFGLQLVTVRHLGAFLDDPLDVPTAVVDFVAGQVGVADPSSVKRYMERKQTRFEHQWEIAEVCGFVTYASMEAELLEWVDQQAWTSDTGPKTLFYAAVAWLRGHRVLLPGVSTLRDQVAGVRKKAESRLHDALAALVTREQAAALDRLLLVSGQERRSQLDLWRHPPRRDPSGRSMMKALDRISEIAALGLGEIDVGGTGVSKRRILQLARSGMNEKAPKLARHPVNLRTATLLATLQWLETRATDDALELFDALMANELFGRAAKSENKDTVKRYPRVVKDAALVKSVVEVLFEAEELGENIPLGMVWEMIEKAVGSRAKIRAAVAGLAQIAPPPLAGADGAWRATVLARYNSVRGFVRMLCQSIPFGATTDAQRVLDAMEDLAQLLETKATVRVPNGYLDARKVDVQLVPAGWWQKLVFATDRPEGTVDRNAYVFCVLELFHAGLKRRDIFAMNSERFSDPRARLLSGPAWEAAKGAALGALLLPEEPDALLAEHAEALDAAWRETAGGMATNTDLSIDAEGRLHLGKDDALVERPSLLDLRRRLAEMIPQVDLSEQILEVMTWQPEFTPSFTAVSDSRTRLADLHVSVAALLTAHALNIGLTAVISERTALTSGRLRHVNQHYLRPETYAAPNTVLIDAQAGIPLSQAWGGGMVAAVDGMRFLVPVRTVDARPNPKYFNRKKGVTWLNMISDQSVGLSGKVVSGTPKDTLHFVDLVINPDSGERPEVLVTDQGSYSDIVFGLVTMLGFDYRPVLADLPDAKLWRINAGADYGALDKAARGRINIGKIRRRWPDILRVVASIHTREVSAHDVIRMLQRDGRPTDLGEAIAHYGRIFKTLHVLTFVDDPQYRREMKGMRNLQEGRHDLARHIFHGRKGELHQAYREGQENQLGALGLVLNCVTLWNTVYLNRAIETLREQGYTIADEDMARLSAYLRRHINVHGHYTFQLPDLSGPWREFRDPDSSDVVPNDD